jgi:myosin III
MSVRDQQLEFVGFAQNVHMFNQEVHKNLRLNKAGIPLNNIGPLPQDYKRPPGFSLIPSLLGSNHHALNLIRANGKPNQSFDELSR